LGILRKEVVLPALVAVLSGVVVLVIEYGVFAQPPKAGDPPAAWETNGFASKVGAHSWGKIGVLDGGQVYLLGMIKDTKPDNRSAALRIEVTYKDKPPWTSRPYPVRGGNGHTQTIGWQALPEGAPAMLLGDDVTQVRVSDCLMVKAPNDDLRIAPEGCADHIRIYPKL
jgi:hypothetical protein